MPEKTYKLPKKSTREAKLFVEAWKCASFSIFLLPPFENLKQNPLCFKL